MIDIEQPIDSIPIENNLAALRGERSLQEVADAVGITKGGLHQLETGKIFPSEKTVKKLCRYYGVDVGQLYSIYPFPPKKV